jgi:hypothetical protein
MDKVNEVLAKETLYEDDIKFLMQNIGILPMTAKVRLGLVPAPAIKAVEVPVKTPITPPVEPATVEVVETPKKVTRKVRK